MNNFKTMKKIIFFFAFLGIFTMNGAMAQNFDIPDPFADKHGITLKKAKAGGDWWEPDTVWVFNTDYEARYTYTYNLQGYNLTNLQQRWQNDTWVNFLLKTYTYDENNNNLTYLSQNWQNDT